jgi:uncharacterized protein (DUF433 family)
MAAIISPVSVPAKTTNLLMRGFYTVQDAARLIEVGNARRIRGWLEGYPKRIGPLIRRDYKPIYGRKQELSFLDLMEIRFIEYFREQGVRVQTLRRCIETAREVWKADKPFATERIRFIASDDRRDILVDEVFRPVAEETKDRKLWSLVTAQFEMFKTLRTELDKGLTFDTSTLLARTWKPRPNEFPEIVINPLIAYGEPTGPSRVPTRVIYLASLTDETPTSIADWYKVPLGEVNVAIRFERHLREGHLIAA